MSDTSDKCQAFKSRIGPTTEKFRPIGRWLTRSRPIPWPHPGRNGERNEPREETFALPDRLDSGGAGACRRFCAEHSEVPFSPSLCRHTATPPLAAWESAAKRCQAATTGTSWHELTPPTRRRWRRWQRSARRFRDDLTDHNSRCAFFRPLWEPETNSSLEHPHIVRCVGDCDGEPMIDWLRVTVRGCKRSAFRILRITSAVKWKGRRKKAHADSGL
jgi:hypothetical protein